MSLLRIELKRGAYGYFNITFDTRSMPPSSSLADYNFQWTAKRTLTQPSPDIFLDSRIVPGQFLIQSSQSVLLVTTPQNTINLSSGAYYWEFHLFKDSNVVADLLSPATKYGDMILLERIS